MAVLDTPRSVHVARGGFAPLTTLFATLSAWNDARMTRKALNALSDRELDDIGLIRGDIDMVALQNKLR